MKDIPVEIQLNTVTFQLKNIIILIGLRN
ncbi:Protein of unknown function [Bacillus mycoides]|nr:Protein of unknown function [Bacillus mycoides]